MFAVKINPDQSLDENKTRVYSWSFLKSSYEDQLNNDFTLNKIVSGIFLNGITANTRHIRSSAK